MALNLKSIMKRSKEVLPGMGLDYNCKFDTTLTTHPQGTERSTK